VKEHRRRVAIVSNGREAVTACGCHVPVWDVVFGRGQDGKGVGGGGGGPKTKRNKEEEEEKVDAGGGGKGRGRGPLRGYGGYLCMILRLAKCSRTECAGPRSSDNNNNAQQLHKCNNHIICLFN
jgi:hypothetical protein